MIEGTANVLGQEIKVSAVVRVQEQQVAIGDNVAGSAHLSQDVPEDLQSDTLEAIIDGNTEISDNASGGANPSAWSNWRSRTTDIDSEITFRYDTQQRVGKVTVYFARDNASMTFPDAGTTEIYISETGEAGSWNQVAVTEIIADSEDPARVKAYTYNFDPVSATFVKLRVVNAKQTGSQVPCTGITEVVINGWNGSYTTHSTAALRSLEVNGLEAGAADLEAGSFDTEAVLIDTIRYADADNAAITYIPPYENAAKLIIESEDHSTRNTFTINLGVKALTSDPEDGSRDYPAGNIMATAGSEYTDGNSATDGSADWALDNNLNTWWHTNWAGGHASGLEERWLTLDLGSVQKIDGYRYYSRSGQSNGRVGGYMIEVSTDGAEWTTSAEGTWENTVGWKLAEFDAVDARYVRLTGVTTYGDGAQQNMFMTATEARVRLAADTTDISSAEVTVPKVKEATVVDEVHPITLSADEITVTLDGKELRYGVDYVVSYENNTAEGTATAVVSGLGQYGYLGTVSAEFAIKVSEGAEITAAGITVKNAPSKNIYTEGETLDPSGLILTAGYSDGSEEDIVYSDETVDGFTFTPNLDTALTAGRITVKVGYDGFETMFDITVNEKPIAIVSVEVAKEPDKTAYTEGETLDPSGLVLHVEYSNGSAGTIGYNSETAGWFGFTPALGTALMSDIKEVTVTYQNHKVMFDITVSEKPTDPEAPDKPDAEDPDKPTGEGPQRPETGRDSQSGDKAVQTGDASNMKVWAGAAVLAGAAIVTAGRKRRSEK